MIVDDTINHINIDPNIAKILKTCRSVLQVKFPVKIKGSIQIFHGWRAVHSNHSCHLKVVYDFPLMLAPRGSSSNKFAAIEIMPAFS